jgi:uncharacterized protein YegJ (DUF2314 family)
MRSTLRWVGMINDQARPRNLGDLIRFKFYNRKKHTMTEIDEYIGKFVKVAFKTGPKPNGVKLWPKSEHMWVKVTKVICGLTESKGNKMPELFGILENDPVFAEVEYGDHVCFMPSEIEDVIDEK